MQNHIGLALRNLQGTLRDVTSTDARRRMDEALMGLQGARLQNDMYRQNVADQRYQDETAYGRGRDALGDIRQREQFDFAKQQASAESSRADERLGLERKRLGLSQQQYSDEQNKFNLYAKPQLEQQRMQIEAANAPATLEDIDSKIPHISAMWKENGLDQQVLKYLNAQPDPKTGQLVYKDGRPVPRHMLDDPNIKRMKAAAINPVENAYFTSLRLQEKIDKGEPLSEQETNLYAKYSNATPEQNVKAMMSHVANLEKTIEGARASGVSDEHIQYLEQKKAESLSFANALMKGGHGDKDTRSTFEKDATFLSRVANISLADAANLLRADETLGDRLQLAKAQIDSIQGRFLPPEEEEVKIQEVLKTMGLSNPETMGLPRQAQGQAAPQQFGGERRVVRTGIDKASGRKVVQYEDGTVEYAE